MGTTLTGTTPQDTYDSLIKVTDNGPLSGTLKALSDGLGNDSTLSLSTTAASIAGTLAVTGATTITQAALSLRVGNATGNSGANILIAGASTTKNWSLGVQQNVGGALEFTPTTTNGGTTLGTTPAMVILDAGNVGIGTSSPTFKLSVNGGYIQNTDGTRSVLFGSDGTGALAGTNTNHYFRFITNDAERLRITEDGYVRLSSGSGGIQFNSDTAAANALDDYEEGTWTMGISFGGASVGVTYVLNTGRYTKIGRQITASGYLVLSSKGSSTGDASITGLPFTSANDFRAITAAALRLDSVSFANAFQAYVDGGVTIVSLGEVTEAGVASNLTNADFQNGSAIMVSVTYTV